MKQSCRENIYRIGEGVPDSYKWNLSGRRLAVLYRFFSAFLVPVAWVFLVIFLEWHVIRIGSLTAGGILWTVVALVVLFYSVLIFLNHLFSGISRRLDPEERHDYILYGFHYRSRRNVRLRAQSLLFMAQLDIRMHRPERAGEALEEIPTDKLSVKQMKLYTLLKLAGEVLSEEGATEGTLSEKGETEGTVRGVGEKQSRASAEDWYIRYSGFSDQTGKFPDNAAVESWIKPEAMENKRTQDEMIAVISGISIEPELHPFLNLFFGMMLAHSIFFPAVQSFTASGWHLRPKYSFFAGGLAGLFVLILGIGILYLLLKKRRRAGSPERGADKARLIIAGIAWVLLVLSLSAMVFLGSWAGTSDQERVLADAVPDPLTGIKYVYLAEEEDYGGISYYRSPDFIFMEEWSEAKDYDTEAGNDLPEAGGEDRNAASAVRGSSAESGGQDQKIGSSSLGASASVSSDSGWYDGGTGSDDSFAAQNAMQAVYEYLKGNGEFQNLSISYSANAKGDLYARIGSGSDVQGTDNSYELRLYDNGEKEADSGFCREIVLEKVYTAEDGETELLDFFLVHPGTLEVTDEHKTDW
ncbi:MULTISPECIES: hypothetical protein [unclassified Bilifractor]|uniref:hypothetical protein n=1 Tax=unclassified Bilifractor TaxID=2815795 RepID=UPI003F91C0BE